MLAVMAIAPAVSFGGNIGCRERKWQPFRALESLIFFQGDAAANL